MKITAADAVIDITINPYDYKTGKDHSGCNEMTQLKETLRLFWQKIIQILFWTKGLDREEIAYINRARAKANNQRILLTAVFVAIIQLSNLIIDALAKPHRYHAGLYQTINACLLGVSVVYFIISALALKRETPRSLRGNQIRLYIFWFLFAAGTMIYHYLDLLERGDLINFIVATFALGVIPLFTPREGAVAFGLLTAVQCLFCFWTDQPATRYQQNIGMLLCAFVFSQVLYHSFMNVQLAQKKMNTYANRDYLTGLYNRRGLAVWLKEHHQVVGSNANQWGCALFDLDFFKNYNDANGHIQGDRCLVRVCELIEESFSGESGAVCRFGGEEMVVFTCHTTAQQFSERLEQVRIRIEEERIPAADRSVSDFVTVSVGYVCTGPQEPFDQEKLIARADRALYAAKVGGHNRVVAEHQCRTLSAG